MTQAKQQWFEKAKDAIHDEENIKGFFESYRWLSNFHVCDIYFEGILYPSTEAAYQAAKSKDIEVRKLFVNVTPSGAKKMGKAVELREDWNDIKQDVMSAIVFDKFYRHLDLRRKLLETENKHLEELNWWSDKYWGTCNGEGENHLGKILMKVREFWQKK